MALRAGARRPARRRPSSLVLRSRAEALRPLRTLRTAPRSSPRSSRWRLGLLLSWAVARTVTRPLAALTDAMKEIAATGDLARRIGPGRPVGRRGRAAAGAHLRHPHRLDRALPARGGAARAALRARPAVHGDRPRGPQPADDHQGLAALAAAGGSGARRGARGGGRHRPRGGAARPHRGRRARLRAAAARRAGAGRRGRARARDAARPRSRARAAPAPRLALEPAAGPVVDRRRAAARRAREPARRTRATRRRAPRGPAGGEDADRDRRPAACGTGRVAPLGRGPRARASPPADLPHVFEPYFTTKRTGTGLGLAIARKIVEALGGTIRLESREGEGTRVEIELPATAPAPAGGAMSAPRAAASCSSTTRRASSRRSAGRCARRATTSPPRRAPSRRSGSSPSARSTCSWWTTACPGAPASS